MNSKPLNSSDKILCDLTTMLDVKRISTKYLDLLMDGWVKTAHSYEGGREFLLFLEEKENFDLTDIQTKWFKDWWKMGTFRCTNCKKGDRHWDILEENEINYCSKSCKMIHERKVNDDLMREWAMKEDAGVVKVKCAGCGTTSSTIKSIQLGWDPITHKLCEECEQAINLLPDELISSLQNLFVSDIKYFTN